MKDDVHLPRWFWTLAALLGVGMILLGATFIVLAFVFPATFGMAGVVVVGYGMIVGALGIGLLLSGIAARRQRPDRLFYAKRGWLAFLLASIIVAVAGLFLPEELQLQPIFGPFHFALIVLPALFLFSLVSLAAGRDAAMSVRQMVVALAGGAASILLALPVELVGLIVSGVAGAALTMILPGGAGEVESLVALLQQWSVSPPTDETQILAVLGSPVVLITLALALGVVTPLIEEFGKTLVMGLVGFWIQPSVVASFVWGVACGLGFAWLEGVSNGAMGLGGANVWLFAIGVRFLATAMHGTTSGLVGAGWGAFWQGRRWMLPLTYGIAVVFHGLWNLNVVLILASVTQLASNRTLGGVMIAVGVLVQVVLVILAISGPVTIPSVLRRRSEGALEA